MNVSSTKLLEWTHTNTHTHTEPWYFWKDMRVNLETEQSTKYLLNSYSLGENKSHHWPEFSEKKKSDLFFLGVVFLNNTQTYKIEFS